MAISITRKKTCTNEGIQLVTVKSISLNIDETINLKGTMVERDILEVTFETTDQATLTKKFIFNLTDQSELGLFIKAVMGTMPEEITDLEAELLGKPLAIEVRNKTKNFRTYSNVVGTFHQSILTRLSSSEDKLDTQDSEFEDTDEDNQEIQDREIKVQSQVTHEEQPESKVTQEPAPFANKGLPRKRMITPEKYRKQMQQ